MPLQLTLSCTWIGEQLPRLQLASKQKCTPLEKSANLQQPMQTAAAAMPKRDTKGVMCYQLLVRVLKMATLSRAKH